MSNRLNYATAVNAKMSNQSSILSSFTIFYNSKFNIRTDGFIETGNRSPDNEQATGCGDCVGILVEIVRNTELTESKLSHLIYFKRHLRKETYILSCKGVTVKRRIARSEY